MGLPTYYILDSAEIRISLTLKKLNKINKKSWKYNNFTYPTKKEEITVNSCILPHGI